MLPALWLSTGVFTGEAGPAGLSARYPRRLRDDPQAIADVMNGAAGLGWGTAALATANIMRATDLLRGAHPDTPLAYICGLNDFVAEVNSALKRRPDLVALHSRIADAAPVDDVRRYFRRIAEEWALPAAATSDPLDAAARLEGTGCRALLVQSGLRGAALEYAVETAHKCNMAYMAEVLPAPTARETAEAVRSAAGAEVDALVIGVGERGELDVYMRALERMGFLEERP